MCTFGSTMKTCLHLLALVITAVYVKGELCTSGNASECRLTVCLGIYWKLSCVDLVCTCMHTAGSSSTYVRWGKSACPGRDTEIVYKGYVGGSHYQSPGGGVEFLCLPEDPTWGMNVGGTASRATIYGTEYELFTGSNPFTTVSINDDVPCCLCRAPRTTNLMIPGRTNCYPGWNQEYTGYLMAGYDGSVGGTTYMCVDENPEAVIGGSATNYGRVMYVVQAHCGSLPCPPYVEGRVLACVVCSL